MLDDGDDGDDDDDDKYKETNYHSAQYQAWPKTRRQMNQAILYVLPYVVFYLTSYSTTQPNKERHHQNAFSNDRHIHPCNGPSIRRTTQFPNTETVV